MREHVPPPAEPEIEMLGRIARHGLRAIRIAMLLAGIAALVYGTLRTVSAEGEAAVPSARGSAWFSVALPLLLPAERLFRRGVIFAAAAAASVALWFIPMALPDDHDYGFILRMFASLIAVLSMLVWRTLWRLGGSDD